ncbi:TRAP transporter large permease [Vibrio sp.]|uniref:TRAP transporter large permease n=1 Tax=Vibrio sp. TaxID=678 RepID=UPI003D0D34B2
MEFAFTAFAVLITLIFMRLPIALALMLVGCYGYASFVGWSPSFALTGQILRDGAMSYTLSAVPLFIFMGTLISRAGLSRDIYAAANTFIGHRKGGLALATIVASGGFAAVSGSSLATVGTMAKVSYPSMKKYNYSDQLSAATIAAGGTLGILIPPSIIMVIYGVMTQTHIGMLFAAGLVPGILGIVGYMIAARLVIARDPSAGPAGEKSTWAQRFEAVQHIGGVVVLFGLIMGGIYGGVFTPTEAAGVGAFGALAFTWWRGKLNWQSFSETMLETAGTTTMMFMVYIGAQVFSEFVAFSGIADYLLAFINDNSLSPLMVMAVMVLVYVVLGCLLEGLSMILLTIPIFLPVVISMGFDPIWFGIVVVMCVEIGFITPPLGLNLFMLNAVVPEISTGTIYRGILPFFLADLARVALVILVPGIVLFLPNLLF